MEKRMSDDLNYIKNKVDNHDKMMHRIVEIAERQASSNEKLNDHIIRTDKRMDKQDLRADKQDVKIANNHNTIIRWTGIITGGLGLITLFTQLSKYFP